MIDIPRLVVSAPHGRSGKTTLCLGLAAAFAGRGLRVQPFKKGPDYIDPGWLGEAAGRPCRNLDLFLVDGGALLAGFGRACQSADLALIEGAHGLYDGLDGEGTNSTAQLARLLQAPVVLVVDASRMTQSVAALVRGFQDFQPGVNVAGVILNQVANPRHRAKLADALSRHTRLPLLGALPRGASLTIPDRHLGLVPRDEEAGLLPVVDQLRRAVEASVDLDGLLDLARRAPPLPLAPAPPITTPAPSVSLGVARDRAFTFYYPENLRALRQAGAELVSLNTLEDSSLPEVDGLYLGGGFPEMFLEALGANDGLRRDIRRAVADGLPIYAECGGLMYLARRITWNGRSASMVGALPCDIEMTGRIQGHGYVRGRVAGANPFFPIGTALRGHEFHYSRATNVGAAAFAYHLERGRGIDGGKDGLVVENVLAAYTHLHALGAPWWAEGLVAMARAYRAGRPAGWELSRVP
ncbi:MAG: hydrogenobyrinic acid a,c-diamide synthase (glutamine-hydrolyzing) [Candidatus Rokubacteria bacterium]|nr:hydrogenobyrinic acid a,c-diamide synthase (glutamine-hydrolyzing) [Candidatus Rokubacteria bacterium]